LLGGSEDEPTPTRSIGRLSSTQLLTWGWECSKDTFGVKPTHYFLFTLSILCFFLVYDIIQW
jgi:hypothetical protein